MTRSHADRAVARSPRANWAWRYASAPQDWTLRRRVAVLPAVRVRCSAPAMVAPLLARLAVLAVVVLQWTAMRVSRRRLGQVQTAT
ncbi:hypothetical protein [Xanthomonas sacchari]|uniref:hypothetical protein n=1 Tax=Xanthomonas sacchari TaxID=56458 RepID=UPI0020C22E46|nr:hypothetical protein [Xanthomonas sacchari]